MKVKITQKPIATPATDMTFLVVQTESGAENADVRRVRPGAVLTPDKLGSGYGACNTAENSTEKAVALDGYYEKVSGGIVAVKFQYAVKANSTLNVDNKGAEPIYYKGAPITAGVIGAGDIATFILSAIGVQSYAYQLIAIDHAEAIPAAATATPSDPGVPAVGGSVKYAREDHTHKAETFIATYGTTTSAQIEAAYQARKYCYVDIGGQIYGLADRVSSTVHTFQCLYGGIIYEATCASDVWSVDDTGIALAEDLETKEDIPEEVTVSDAGAVDMTNTPLDAGKIYHFTGALTALTITLNAASANQLAHYHFDFLSGSTAATLTLPNTVVMPSGFTVEANKRYEIDILNNYGVVVSW